LLGYTLVVSGHVADGTRWPSASNPRPSGPKTPQKSYTASLENGDHW